MAADTQHPEMQASFSVLAMSIASSAAIALGLAPDPHTGKHGVDKHMAKFNIDLLLILQEKTKGNLQSDEQNFMTAVLRDLQAKYITL